MNNIGILAYGSLIEDPGVELGPLICDRIVGIESPFHIEFSRSSRTRDGAPTVVPVESLGAPVKAVILVLHESVDIELAKDLLYRRETRSENSNRHYSNPVDPSPNQIMITEINNLYGVATVIYTRFAANIYNPTAIDLARLAIKSTAGKSGLNGQDGISYLMSLKRQKILTPLMAQYEAEILNSVGVLSLEEALNVLKMRASKC